MIWTERLKGLSLNRDPMQRLTDALRGKLTVGWEL